MSEQPDTDELAEEDYPGHELSKLELLTRIAEAYQLAGALLLASPQHRDAPEIRDEMVIVLLDFLSNPGNATSDRLRLATRGFTPFPKPATITFTSSTSGTTGTVDNIR